MFQDIIPIFASLTRHPLRKIDVVKYNHTHQWRTRTHVKHQTNLQYEASTTTRFFSWKDNTRQSL